MDSQGSESVKGFQEQFHSLYPNVSLQQLGDKGSNKVTQSVEKRSPARTHQKSSVGQKTPLGANAKAQQVKTTANSPRTPAINLNAKPPVVFTPKTITPTQAKAAVAAKSQVVTKTPVVPKTPAQVLSAAKGKVATAPVTPKTTVPIPQGAKTPVSNVKTAAVKTPVAASTMKTVPQKATPVKTVQNIVKQQTPNVAKAPGKPTPKTKDDAPDQSTMTVVTYNMPPSNQHTLRSNQLTIEKIEQQQRIPVVLESNNPVLLRTTPALLVQNRVPVDGTQVQSVVIGTSTLPAVVAPQVEITTSEPLQALQVTQQVTLFGPKGKPFAVDDVKKQINLNKQTLCSTMTNVVSSTTNPIPVPTALPTQSVQPEQKKAVVSARTQEPMLSPVRVSNRVSAAVRGTQKVGKPAQQPSTQVSQPQYASTRGQVKKVSPKREIPMQKVSPLPPSMPPPDMIPANEEEVTTSEELPSHQPSGEDVKLILLLPNGGRKELTIPSTSHINCTLGDLIGSMGVTQEMVTSVVTETEQDPYQDLDSNGAQWSSVESTGAEPGEILGLQDDMEAGVIDNGEIMAEQSGETDDSQKEVLASRGEPVYREGKLAVCQFCGYTSIDFNQCQRCNRKIPPNCKTVSADFPQVVAQKGRKTKADSLGGESPKKKRVCRKKKVEEPVCLTISDDEELLGLGGHHHQINEESVHSDSSSNQMSSCDKEPLITEEMVSELKQSVSGGGLDLEELLDTSAEDQTTTLQCRTVRIGSYKVVPKDKVVITPFGIKVTVPTLPIHGSSQIVDLKILHLEIIKVLIHFGRCMPVLFIYTRPAAAARIRKALGMTDKEGLYYDSMSSNETHRRITFLPDKIDETSKAILKEIYENPENNVFAELTGKEANDILVKASPKEVQAFLSKKQPAPIQQQQPFNGQNIQTIMVYPPPPEKGGIPINTEDYACLDCDQFLNDVIIDFYLKYVVEKTLSPEDRARTHVFSSFFYKRLTTKPPPKRKSMNPVENDPTASPAVKRHSRVKSWTKNVDLFAKDFIVIPINENSHWFLAIICFPGLTGPVRFSDNTPIELPSRKKKKPEDKAALSGKHTVTIGSTTITAVTPMQGSPTLDLGDDVEDRDEADGEDERMDVPDEDEDISQKEIPEVKEEPEEEEVKPKKKEREPIKQPCILIFDSLAGASRARVVATLRDYVRVEYEAKHGETRDFSGDVLKGSNVKCPQQTNYTDCGLYVLQYVEAFFRWPITDFHIPITQVMDWFQAEIVTRKRYDIQQLLLHLMEEQRIDVEALNLPILNLSPDMGLRFTGSDEEDEDEDDEQMGEEEEDEDEMLGEDGEYNEEMDHDNDMEEGEIGMGHHEDEDDPENYLDPALDHEEHELDDEDYDDQMCEEEEEPMPDDMDELEDEKMEDISLTPIGSVKVKDLKNYRIPRLAEKDRSSDSV